MSRLVGAGLSEVEVEEAVRVGSDASRPRPVRAKFSRLTFKQVMAQSYIRGFMKALNHQQIKPHRN